MANNIDAHPLFPAKDEDTEPPEVVTIQVYRREGVRMILIPRRYMAEELIDETQISNDYGGGVYELVARNHACITCRRGVELAGPSKPLYDVESMPTPPPVQQAMNQHLVPQGAPQWWIPLVGVLAPVALELIKGQAEDRRRSQEAHQAMMATMMSDSRNSSMQMVTLLTNLKSNTPNGAEFKEGMTFMENIISQQIEKMKGEENEGDDVQSTIAQVMQAIQLAQSIGGQTPPGTGTNGAT